MSDWKDPKRKDRIIDKALKLVEEILDNPRSEMASEEAGKLARTILTSMAYPLIREPSININVLTSEALMEAKRKAGLLDEKRVSALSAGVVGDGVRLRDEVLVSGGGEKDDPVPKDDETKEIHDPQKSCC